MMDVNQFQQSNYKSLSGHLLKRKRKDCNFSDKLHRLITYNSYMQCEKGAFRTLQSTICPVIIIIDSRAVHYELKSVTYLSMANLVRDSLMTQMKPWIADLVQIAKYFFTCLRMQCEILCTILTVKVVRAMLQICSSSKVNFISVLHRKHATWNRQDMTLLSVIDYFSTKVNSK